MRRMDKIVNQDSVGMGLRNSASIFEIAPAAPLALTTRSGDQCRGRRNRPSNGLSIAGLSQQ
jgi:hypothetical protein